jgi:hypothetical protein
VIGSNESKRSKCVCYLYMVNLRYVTLSESSALQETNGKHCPLSIVQNGMLMQQEGSNNSEYVVLLKDHIFYDFIFTTRFRVTSGSSHQSPIVGEVFVF